MRKSNRVQVRSIEPDVVYKNLWIAKLINKMMHDGKKTIATNIVYEAISMALETTKATVEDLVAKITQHVSPKVGTTQRKLGGTVYKVPIELDERRSQQIGIKFIVTAARARLKTSRTTDGKVMSMKKNRTISEALGAVLSNAYSNTKSDAVEEVNKLAALVNQNLAFGHLSHASKSKSRKQSVKNTTTKAPKPETAAESIAEASTMVEAGA